MVEPRSFNPPQVLHSSYLLPDVKKFSDSSQLREWALAEANFWRPLVDFEEKSRVEGKPQVVADHVRLNNELATHAQEWGNGTDNPHKEKIDEILSMYAHDQLIPSKSSLARYIAEIISTKPVRATATLAAATQKIGGKQYSWYTDHHFPRRFNVAIDGWIELALHTRGIIDQLRDSQLSELEVVKAAFNTEYERLIDLTAKAEKEWKDKIEGYEAKVALGAPRKFWSERAIHHEGRAGKAISSWNRWVLGITAIGLTSAFLSFTAIGNELWTIFSVFILSLLKISIAVPADAPRSDPYAALFKQAIVFGTFMGIAIWWLRQKLRDRRSHEHLAEDAAERVTMLETYAAMKGAGLETADLGHILNALYRPANTGLISEADGGPITPFEVLLKNLDKVGSKKD